MRNMCSDALLISDVGCLRLVLLSIDYFCPSVTSVFEQIIFDLTASHSPTKVFWREHLEHHSRVLRFLNQILNQVNRYIDTSVKLSVLPWAVNAVINHRTNLRFGVPCLLWVP